MKLQLEETKQQIESQKVEQQKLQKIIADTDAEVFQLKKQLEQVICEAARRQEAGECKANPFVTEMLFVGKTSREGGERSRQPGEAPSAPQQRVLAAVREDPHSAVSPQQRRLSLQPARQGHRPPEVGAAEAAAEEEHPGQHLV